MGALPWFVLAVSLVATSACGALPIAERAGSGSLVSWHDYGDLDELVEASDLVVEAHVVRRLGARDVRSHPAQRVPVAFTEFVVEARSALKGDSAGPLHIVQLGKEGDPAQRYPEFPLLRPGSDVVLFLVDVTTEPIHADGTTKYGILPPVGLLLIENGRLRSTALGFESADEAASMSLGDLRARVRNLVGDLAEAVWPPVRRRLGHLPLASDGS
ncbi:MAG: hypothetical protein ACRDJJ_10885 [Actinomycetota bacterium]